MNKQEAATLLGVSVRTLESYVAGGRLPVHYIKGKTRPVADFDASNVERLQTELTLSIPRTRQSQTSQDKANPQEPRNSEENPATSQGRNAQLVRALPQTNARPVVVIEGADFQVLLQAVSAANSATSQTPQNLAGKMLLTLSEAQILTGLSRETLKTAINDGFLPAKQIGRAWRLRPEDVRRWLHDFFEKSS